MFSSILTWKRAISRKQVAERDAEFSSVLSAFDTPNEALLTGIKLFTRRSLATRAWWGNCPSSKTSSSSYQGDRQLDDHLLDVDGDCMGPRPTYKSPWTYFHVASRSCWTTRAVASTEQKLIFRPCGSSRPSSKEMFPLSSVTFRFQKISISLENEWGLLFVLFDIALGAHELYSFR